MSPSHERCRMRRNTIFALSVFVAPFTLACATLPVPDQATALLTPGETSQWERISSHDEVIDFYRQLQGRSPWVRTFHLGWSRERRELLALTLARPAVTTPAEAHASGKAIVFIAAQAHGDEPAGKEGLMLFARDLATGPLDALLDSVIFVFVPQINPDGAESAEWGTRMNPSGYNLNRDYVRLDNPETKAIVHRGIVRWEPHVIIDAHEAFGPPRFYDFYTSISRAAYGPSAVVDFTENEVLPAVVGALERAGYTHYFYHTVPSGIVDDTTRFISKGGGGARSLSAYGGPHGAITMLYESLRRRDSRIGLERRARMHWTAMEGMGRYVAANASRVRAVIAEGRREMIMRGSRWDAEDSVFVRWESFITHRAPYKVWNADTVVNLMVQIQDGRRPTLGRIRPEGYVIEAHREDVAQHLGLHGLVVERTMAPVTVQVESYRVDSVTRSEPNEGAIPRRFATTLEEGAVEFPAGTWIVRAGQKHAGLLFHMLEPEDTESLAAGGWFINQESPRARLPIHRIRRMPSVATQVRDVEYP